MDAIEKSKHLLLWGIKILAERYWRVDFKSTVQINFDLIKNTLELMPGSEILLNQFQASYKEDEIKPLFKLESIFTKLKISSEITLENKHYLPPIFDFDSLNLPEQESNINYERVQKIAPKFDQYSTSSESELLLNVLQKYGGFLPILNNDNCAMPLYEYVKLAAALATNYAGDFRLVVGDLSGIQDFIYTISSENALKVLRARSFYLELMMKTVAYEICDNLKLTSANIFYAGGGNFLLLLPESDELNQKLNLYYKAINGYFSKQFHGNLHLTFADVQIKNAELKSSNKTSLQNAWNYLFEKKLTLAKNKKLKPPYEDNLLIADSEPLEVEGKSCAICHDDSRHIQLDEENGYCSFCQELRDIGTNLHKEKNVQVYRFDERFIIPDLSDDIVWPFVKSKKLPLRTFNINQILENANPPFFYGNYITTKKENPAATAEFEDMAKDAIGAERIATLAMDVDNMSLFFREGFQCDDPREFLIYAPTLSRMLDYFFKIGLNYICEKPDFRILGNIVSQESRKLSIIYSGGDDLLLVGAWNDIAEAAIDIQLKFQDFTCYNSDFGISGGMYISNHSFPFYVSVSKAKEAESRYAKANYDPKDKLKKKNSIVLFYDDQSSFLASRVTDILQERYLLAAKWPEVNEFIIERLRKFLLPTLVPLKDGKLDPQYSRNFIGKLFDLHQKYLSSNEGEIYIPDLVYHYSRLEKNLRDKLEPIYKDYVNYQKKQPENPIRYLPVVLNWLELLLREKGE